MILSYGILTKNRPVHNEKAIFCYETNTAKKNSFFVSHT